MAQTPDDEDDYLTMSFDEPKPTKGRPETLTEKRKRKALESERRGRPKSKAELAAEEAKKREEALGTSSLENTNKGFKMMAALGYKPGEALGTGKQNGLLEPVGVEMKIDRGGIGADAEKKRKIREEMEKVGGEEKRRKVDAEEYRVRQAAEREERRNEGLLIGAMKVAEGLDEGDEEKKEGERREQVAPTPGEPKKPTDRFQRSKPLKSINVLWRSLIKKQRVTERDKRMRHDVQANLLDRLPTYDDPDEDNDDKIAFAKKSETEEVAIDLDEEDPELEEFEAVDVGERLKRVVEYLRKRWHYCFWCKFRYQDEKMEGCPGVEEADHD